MKNLYPLFDHPLLDQICDFQVEYETVKQLLESMVLPLAPITTIQIKFDEQFKQNKIRLQKLEQLRKPIEDIRRDLNTQISTDLWTKFVEVSKQLQLLESELVLGIVDSLKPTIDEWLIQMDQINDDVHNLEVKRVQGHFLNRMQQQCLTVKL